MKRSVDFVGGGRGADSPKVLLVRTRLVEDGALRVTLNLLEHLWTDASIGAKVESTRLQISGGI